MSRVRKTCMIRVVVPRLVAYRNAWRVLSGKRCVPRHLPGKPAGKTEVICLAIAE